MAQLIDSPNTFHIQPMQIDTKNRHYNGTDFKPDLLPGASAAPPDASYSGLLECPCTTRIHKDINITYATQNQGTCDTVVNQPKECQEGALKIDPTLANAPFVQVDSASFPSGCSIVHYKNGTSAVVSNKHAEGAQCGAGASRWLGSSSSDTTKVEFSLDLDQSSDRAAMNITGPDGKWFGVGLDATSFSMSDKPYAIIIDGTGKVQERKLGDHDGGSAISSSVQIVSNKVVDGRRMVSLTRYGVVSQEAISVRGNRKSILLDHSKARHRTITLLIQPLHQPFPSSLPVEQALTLLTMAQNSEVVPPCTLLVWTPPHVCATQA